jgi:hypothetical protein
MKLVYVICPNNSVSKSFGLKTCVLMPFALLPFVLMPLSRDKMSFV